jgi:hypothetical protein
LNNAVMAAKILNEPVDTNWLDVEKNIPILNLPNGVTSEYAG